MMGKHPVRTAILNVATVQPTGSMSAKLPDAAARIATPRLGRKPQADTVHSWSAFARCPAKVRPDTAILTPLPGVPSSIASH